MADGKDSIPTLARLRLATGEIHGRLERNLDAIERFADPQSRAELAARFAALHMPAGAALARKLEAVAGLDLATRDRNHLFAAAKDRQPLPEFPEPRSTAEALGMLYVLEGSTLGGRLILRALRERGVDVSGLAFLDPYGAETGARWRSFLAILERETAGDAERIGAACEGALRAFAHTEAVLCGVPA